MDNSDDTRDTRDDTRDDIILRNPTWGNVFLANWLIADPNFIALSQSKSYKNYQAQKHKGLKFVYLFGGRLRVVKEAPLNVGVLVLLVALGILFFVFEAEWVWHHVHGSVVIIFAYCWSICILMLIRAATSDPGILPRNVHIPYDLRVKEHASDKERDKHLDAPLEYFNTISLPYFDDKYNGVSVKYCTTCHVWRPPRTSHCGVCNACVVNHDHHCIYINNCVGLRNYKYFLWFTLTATVCGILVIVCSFVQIFHYRNGSDVTSFKQSIGQVPGSFFLLIMTFLSIVYPLSVFVVHVLLSSQNLSTREYLNNYRGNKTWTNVFKRGILRNLYLNWIVKNRGVSFIRLLDRYRNDDIRMADLPPFE